MHASVAVLVLALAAAASAQFAQPQFAQQVRAAPVPIIGHQHTQDDFGQYAYSYATGDGASHSDHGALKQAPEGYVLVRQGSHQYTSPEGRLIKLSYIADENGYQPTGEHLPVAITA